MKLETEAYVTQMKRWPSDGRCILAHYDDASIIVYQAYNAAIADYAVAHGRLGGPAFSFTRMSWIKPNFLWMMYRSGWGSKENQERTLGFRLAIPHFEQILEAAVPSTFDADLYADHTAWKADVERSEIRLQWDPDHTPSGAKTARRAIQLGLRGDALKRFAAETLEVIDLTPFVAAQAAQAGGEADALLTPLERPFEPASAQARQRVRLDKAD